MRIHLIAIGGAAMHNLALELKYRNHEITGSDDAIYEPSKSRLAAVGLLPSQMGWFEEQITPDLDLVILGMHAKADNPELIKAQSLGIKVMSYPEFVASLSEKQKRIVIAGSHGKTTITSMVLHAMKKLNLQFNYLVGAQIKGFDRMVKLDPDAEFMVIEGDEYLSSPIDLKSKFLWYRPHAAVISGVAWDHINVFPTWESYVSTFDAFIKSALPLAPIFYFEGDKTLNQLAAQNNQATMKPYAALEYSVDKGKYTIHFEGETYSSRLIGEHNFQNLNAAAQLCRFAGISTNQFLEAMQDFDGAAKRMEMIVETPNFIGIKDFAHSPSKVMATVKAAKQTYPNHKLIAVLELHTFSSLKRDFLPHYASCLDHADEAIVFTDEAVFKQKNYNPFSAEEVQIGFANKDLVHTLTFSRVNEFVAEALGQASSAVLLVMTSGNFGGEKIEDFIQRFAQKFQS